MSIRNAILDSRYREIIKEYLFSTFKDKNEEFFDLLHKAFFSSGFFILVKRNANIELPLYENKIKSNTPKAGITKRKSPKAGSASSFWLIHIKAGTTIAIIKRIRRKP